MVIFENIGCLGKENPMLNKIILEDLEHRCFQKSSSHPDTSSEKNHEIILKNNNQLIKN